MCLARANVVFPGKPPGCRRPRSASPWASSSRAARSAGLVDDPHAAAAAAEGGLDDQGKADRAGDAPGLLPVGDRLARFRAGSGSGGAARRPARRVLSPIRSSSSGRGPTKMIPARCAGPGEVRVFREKAVARMDRVDALFLGEPDDALDVEVGRHRALARPDQVRLIGLVTVQAEPVLLRVDRDRAQVELRAGPENPDGDLAAVGGHQFLDRADRGRGGRGRRVGGRHPGKTGGHCAEILPGVARAQIGPRKGGRHRSARKLPWAPGA